MVLYEVNLTLNSVIELDYVIWLNDHIKEILLIDGFKGATLYYVSRDNDCANYCVQYTVDTEELLQVYFENFAPKLRNDALNKFGDKFSVTRRVLKLKQNFNKLTL